MIIDFKTESRRNMALTMDKLFENRAETADVNFVFEGNNVTVRVPAHKMTLIIGSEVFEEMFLGPDKHFIEGDIPTRSSTISSRTFDEFIALFYGQWSVINMNNHDDLWRLSNNFSAASCIKACEILTPENVESESVDR